MASLPTSQQLSAALNLIVASSTAAASLRPTLARGRDGAAADATPGRTRSWLLFPLAAAVLLLFAVFWAADLMLWRLESARPARLFGRRKGARKAPAQLRAGDWVEVKSAGEIAASLDADGKLDGLPFMPEMARFCGQRLKVHRRADKTCVEGHGLRALDSTVLLAAARCDGAFHDGCERGCLMFWKEAWLRPAEASPSADIAPSGVQAELKAAKTRVGERYICQSTCLAEASAPLPVSKLWRLWRELFDGEIRLLRFAEIWGRLLANRVRRLAGLEELGAITGPGSKPRPPDLGLRPGELVRVKTADRLRLTLDRRGKTRGLSFEPEMSRHIGRVYRVDRRIERIIHEETGKMIRLRGTVALADVICEGRCVKNCPRANLLYWREDWLERVDHADGKDLPIAAE